jgi:hypothetical protein
VRTRGVIPSSMTGGGGEGREQRPLTQQPSGGIAQIGAAHPPDDRGRRGSQTKGRTPNGTGAHASLSCQAEGSRRIHALWEA